MTTLGGGGGRQRCTGTGGGVGGCWVQGLGLPAAPLTRPSIHRVRRRVPAEQWQAESIEGLRSCNFRSPCCLQLDSY